MRQDLTPGDPGFALRAGDEGSLFKWFLASVPFGNGPRQAWPCAS